MLKLAYILSLFVFGLSLQVQAQGRMYTVQECLAIAHERNITAQQADLNMSRGEINLKQSKQMRIPTLSMSGNIGSNFGRSIDPSTNTFDTKATNFQTYNLSSGVLLYGGRRLYNNVQQAKIDIASLEQRNQDIYDQLSLQVLQAFLNVLLAKENIRNAETQLNNSAQSNRRMEILIERGLAAEVDAWPLKSQIANDSMQYLNRLNDLLSSKLALSQLMMLDEGLDFDIQLPQVDLLSLVDRSLLDMTADEIYAIALENQPKIKAEQYELESTKLNHKLSRASGLPSIFLNGSASTNYSNQFIETYNQRTEFVETPIVFNNMPATIGFPQPKFDTREIKYFDQLDQNLGYGFTLALQIPILNNFQAKNNVALADIATQDKELAMEQTRRQLRSDIQNALLAAKQSEIAYRTSQTNVIVQENAYKAATLSAENGKGSSYDQLISSNNLNNANVNLSVSKYNFVFNMKVLDYYLGRRIEF